MNEKIRVRFPPSPTGYCHVGTARMALLNYLFAKKADGAIIFRSEDTDRERSSKEYEDDIIDQLEWLGLSWDEFYRQSERMPLYQEAIQKLLDSGKAYVSKEESTKTPGLMMEVIRLRNPGSTVTFHDIIRGDITFDTTELKDFVIARSKQDPLYHLAVVVDDADQRISHVIRGEDHISNTPRQILIQEALGYERPQYAHYPLNLAADKSKLSKRKGDVAIRQYREQGYLPRALLNYLAIVGWTPPSGREFLSLPELIAEFDLKDVHKSGGVFDVEKLRWYNRHYLLELSDEKFERGSLPVLESAIKESELPWRENIGQGLLPTLRERISVWSDIKASAAEGEFDFFFTPPEPKRENLPGKGGDPSTAAQHLGEARRLIEALPGNFSPDQLKQVLWPYANGAGRAAVLWPLRYALSGKERSPDPFTIASVIGKEETLSRIDRAIESLHNV